jgi:hypothetical protein
MKKSVLSIILAIAVSAIVACKDQGSKGLPTNEGPIKYARVAVSVFKDEGLAAWGSNLSKTEPVILLETLKVQIKGTETEVAKIKLSDGNIFYVNMRHLADKPVVFVEDTKAYVRNNISSRVFAIIPRGTIGFVTQEMDGWVQIYAGQIDGKWITQQWVNGGFTEEETKIREAKNYEESIAILNNRASKQDQISRALAVLKDMSNSSGMFAEMASSVLDQYSDHQSSDAKEDKADSSGSDTLQEAKVSADKGLTMREEAGVSAKAIVVIPNGSTVKILKKGDTEEKIGEKTAPWYQVDWNGKKGWVFGGFLVL